MLQVLAAALMLDSAGGTLTIASEGGGADNCFEEALEGINDYFIGKGLQFCHWRQNRRLLWQDRVSISKLFPVYMFSSMSSFICISLIDLEFIRRVSVMPRFGYFAWLLDGSVIKSEGNDDNLFLWCPAKNTKRVHYWFAY